MAALLRHNCSAHRMGRHGLPNFLVPREGFAFASWRRDPLAPPAQTGSSISRRRRRAQRDYRLPCEKSPTDPLASGDTILQQEHPSAAPWWKCNHGRIFSHRRTQCWDDDQSGPGMADVLQRHQVTIFTVAGEHSPSKPFLVSNWVGAQALTGQGGQPSRGSSATAWLAESSRV